MKPILLTVVGTFGSGKDTVGEYLAEKHGFMHVSSSDIVREESRKRYDSIEREYLLKTANELREMHGADILGEMSYKRYADQQDEYPAGVVMTGLRNVQGAKVVKNYGGFIVFVDAPIEIRYERVQARKRDTESEFSLEDFRKGEEKELLAAGKNHPNLLAVKEIADYHLMNDRTLEDFEHQIEDLLTSVKYEVQ